MARTFTADLQIPEDGLQSPAGPHLLQSSGLRPECKVSQPKRSDRTSNDWRPAKDPAPTLRPNSTAKTIQASPFSGIGIAPSAERTPARRPTIGKPTSEQPPAKKPLIKQPLVRKTPANNPLAKKRKAPDGDRPRTTKTKPKPWQNAENINGQTEEQELWPVDSSDRVKPNSNNGTLNYIPDTTLQDSNHEGDKRTQRKREASILEGPQDNRASVSKRTKTTELIRPLTQTIEPIRPLTRKNLKLLEKSMASDSKRSNDTALPSRRSGASCRSLSASNLRFQLELEALNIDFTEVETPDPEEVTRLLKVMERNRGSPEPDSKHFHEVRRLVRKKNEASITKRLSPLLLVARDLPSNDQKTSNLLYCDDTSWNRWGSAQPGRLPVPKPDLCISYKGSAFNSEEREHIRSPYLDTAGFAPFLICEVKTALQGDEVADRQNANNVLLVLKADFKLQQTLGRDRAMERKVRLITTAHNTRTQWYHVWFYVLGDDGNPKWCYYLIKRISIDGPSDNGFETARGCFLNLCEHFDSVVLPKLRADLAEVSTLGLSSVNVAPFQPVLRQALGMSIRTNSPLSTELHYPNVTPSDDSDNSEADGQPASKRARATT